MANVFEMKKQKICVFGSSSEKIDRDYLDSAEHLGKSLAEHGKIVVFGGGRYGVMGAVARGVTAAGGKLIGVSPKFFIKLGVLIDNFNDLIFTETMRDRKGIMEDTSDAFIICAGGIGTFEEFFEVLTLKQLGKHSKQIIVYNYKGYYDELLKMMDASIEKNFMTEDIHKIYSVANTEDEVFEQLENYKKIPYNKYD
jgi:uncharacterized protein (TIGR00730 family)